MSLFIDNYVIIMLLLHQLVSQFILILSYLKKNSRDALIVVPRYGIVCMHIPVVGLHLLVIVCENSVSHDAECLLYGYTVSRMRTSSSLR